MDEVRYPTVYLDGKVFSSLGNFGDRVKIVLDGKITSKTENNSGGSLTVEIYGVGGSDKNLKDTGIKVANEADKSLAKLETVASPSSY